MPQMILHGEHEKDIQVKKSEVNHLRLLLAWMRCEYMLDEDMQKGYAKGATEMVRLGFSTEESAREILVSKAAEIRHVPIYVRQAVKMLTAMIREHDKAGDTVDAQRIPNRLESMP